MLPGGYCCALAAGMSFREERRPVFRGVLEGCDGRFGRGWTVFGFRWTETLSRVVTLDIVEISGTPRNFTFLDSLTSSSTSDTSGTFCGARRLVHGASCFLNAARLRDSQLNHPYITLHIPHSNDLPHRQLSSIDISVLVLFRHGSPRVIRVRVLAQRMQLVVPMVDVVPHKNLNANGVVVAEEAKVRDLSARKNVWVCQKKTEALDGRLEVLVDCL
jgi:hypothetical protein